MTVQAVSGDDNVTGADTKKTSATFVADISLNCRPTFFDSRPITGSIIEVTHAHLPSMHPLVVF